MRAKIKIECSDENYEKVIGVLRVLEAEVTNFDTIIKTDRSNQLRLVKGDKLWPEN